MAIARAEVAIASAGGSIDSVPTTAVSGGAWTQVSRLGMPLVNEVVIGLKDKDKFNASKPKDDAANFADYVTHPTLPALVDAAPSTGSSRPPVEATGLPSSDSTPRSRMVAMKPLNRVLSKNSGAA